FAGNLTPGPAPRASPPRNPPDARLETRLEPGNIILDFWSGTGQTSFRVGTTFLGMPRTIKPDPELLPIHRPRCPDCQMRMMTADVMPGPEGLEYRSYECPNCAHTETRIEDSDPLDVVRWIARETGPPLLRETGNGRDPRQQTNNPASTK